MTVYGLIDQYGYMYKGNSDRMKTKMRQIGVNKAFKPGSVTELGKVHESNKGTLFLFKKTALSQQLGIDDVMGLEADEFEEMMRTRLLKQI